jgi:hypothetical protein
MSARPVKLPRWAVDGSQNLAANVVEPSSGEKDTGFTHGSTALSSYFDWLFAYVYLWLQYFSDGVVTFVDISASTLTTTGNITIGGNVTATGNGQMANLTVTVSENVGGTLTAGGLITANAGVTVPSGQTATFNGSVVANGNTTLGDAAGDALTVNATTSFVGPPTFSATATFNGALVANGNTTLGDTSGDTLTANATTSLAGPVTFNASATVATGKTLTMTDGASALKGMTYTVTQGIDLADCLIITGSVASQPGPALVGITIPANTTYSYRWRIQPASHETITALNVVFDSSTSAGRVSSISLKYMDHAYTKTTVTGLSFNQSGQSGVMSGTPSVTLNGPAGRVYFIEVAVGGGGSATLYGLEMTVTS